MLTKSNVDRKLEARGDNSETKKIMQIAEKMSRDPDSGFEIQLLQGAKELFDKYGKPGETWSQNACRTYRERSENEIWIQQRRCR